MYNMDTVSKSDKINQCNMPSTCIRSNGRQGGRLHWLQGISLTRWKNWALSGSWFITSVNRFLMSVWSQSLAYIHTYFFYLITIAPLPWQHTFKNIQRKSYFVKRKKCLAVDACVRARAYVCASVSAVSWLTASRAPVKTPCATCSQLASG